jgi:hypothetical protein
MFHKHDWVHAEGTIVEVRVKPGSKDPFLAPKTYVVDVRPATGEPFRAEIPFGSYDIAKIFQPSVGEVTGFRVDAKSKKVEFDKTDPRNDVTMRMANSSERLRQTMRSLGMAGGGPGMAGAFPGMAGGGGDLAGLLASLTGASTPATNGPKWLVPTECPNCGARIDQAVAEYQDNPLCPFCSQPVPVQPAQAQAHGPGLSPLQALVGTGVWPVTRSPAGSAAQLIESGEPVQATLVGSTPLPGMKNAAGEDVTMLLLNVTAPDGTRYETKTGQHVPAEATRLLTPGTVLPGKRTPGQANGPVVIDWAKALAGAGPA